ncbi:sodium:alanine symporter family protein [Nocardia tengchongensis]|uniref:Sodium:alanine symporter family protein n=1 Tax=Nocardia tengchongensis TaxID=2055889 RepID=A0ABX8CKD0_9NOCA|nr:alanine:cation symporter family protein [Nocardia tengchongensis]QVI20432.1 sodium:alanine symporter family protein [Nocardia tengchongensis]
MDALDSAIVHINDVFWTWLLIPIVIAAGLYFTWRSRIVQLSLLPEMFRSITERTEAGEDGKRPVSAFGAFTISAAARVGTGNIAGVAAAITLGGSGAVFWMWLMAIVGSASAFVESTLAQLYKVRDREPGTFRGGPAYYMERGLGRRWMGALFAVVITLTFGFVFNAVQSNTIVATGKRSLSALVLVAVFGGALGSLTLVWNLADVFMGVMALVNLAAIIPLGAVAFRLLDDYQRQRRAGNDPVYVHNPDIADASGIECWQESRTRESASETTD